MNDNTSNDLVEELRNASPWLGRLAAEAADQLEISAKLCDLMQDRAMNAEARLEIAREALEENEEYWKVAHDLIENARETVRLKIVYDKRPPGLFQDLQNAVYICRGRNVEALRSIHPDGDKK